MKNQKIILFTTLVSTAFFTACSTGESIQSKMNRYQANNSRTNYVPEIKVATISFKTANKNRAPASVKTETDKSLPADPSMTNKRLYFLTLVDQYETLKKYADQYEAPKVALCPNFHTGLLNHYEKYSSNSKKVSMPFRYDIASIQSEEYVERHPEFFLPVTKESNFPRVIDIIKSKKVGEISEVSDLVKKAVDIHLTKTYHEITELCEYGSSDNYFIYENLITFVKSSEFNPSKENMNILLKTSVFSNMAILSSLENQKEKMGRTIASTEKKSSHYTDELMSKMNVEWSNEYFKNLNN